MEFYTDNFVPKDTSNRISNRRRRLMIKAVAAFNHSDHLKGRLMEGKRDQSDFDKPFLLGEEYTLSKIENENFKMELLTLKEKEAVANKDRKVILQIHGGGYINAFKLQYNHMACWYSESRNGADVLSIDYRVAPKDLFPAALEDAVYSYKWLLEQGYKCENIVVAGDSAGGGLSLALCLYLRDHGIQLPGGIIGMSPWTDVTMSGSSYTTNYEIDAVLGGSETSIIYNNPYPGKEDPKNPYISPLYGDYSGFPPMLIQVGKNEMLLDDSLGLAKKARDAGVKVRLSEYEDMFHVFQLSKPMLSEAKIAWEEVEAFLKHIDENLEN